MTRQDTLWLRGLLRQLEGMNRRLERLAADANALATRMEGWDLGTIEKRAPLPTAENPARSRPRGPVT